MPPTTGGSTSGSRTSDARSPLARGTCAREDERHGGAEEDAARRARRATSAGTGRGRRRADGDVTSPGKSAPGESTRATIATTGTTTKAIPSPAGSQIQWGSVRRVHDGRSDPSRRAEAGAGERGPAAAPGHERHERGEPASSWSLSTTVAIG